MWDFAEDVAVGGGGCEYGCLAEGGVAALEACYIVNDYAADDAARVGDESEYSAGGAAALAFKAVDYGVQSF